jgi:hypothetical protein
MKVENNYFRPPTPTYTIVGSGRVANHLKKYFDLLCLKTIQWSRKNSTAISNDFFETDIILLAISDRAIEDFYHSHPILKSKKCVHFSGSLVIPNIPSCYPLYTFGVEFYDLESYQNIAFVCEKERDVFSEYFPTLKNPHYNIPAESKALYHALCVMAGNFPQILWNKSFKQLSDMGIPQSAQFNYLKKVFNNFMSMPDQNLTGPLVRGDTLTIDANIKSLSGDPYQKVYSAFVEAFKNEHS